MGKINNNTNNQKPLVSVSCITYNQHNYIRDCLEGFLMQKTNFPFEVLIHDDASNDGTTEIIIEYQKKYPFLFKPIIQRKNTYSVPGHKPINSWNYERAQGKYIAFCEGDDFWCDPQKLQTQFDFMEENHDFSLCYHARYVIDEIKKIIVPSVVKNIQLIDTMDILHQLLVDELGFHTQTIFVRKKILFDHLNEIYADTINCPMEDLQIAVHMTLAGKIKYMPNKMACYRVAPGSVTAFENEEKQKIFIDRAKKAHCFLAKKYGQPEWVKEIQLKQTIKCAKQSNKFYIQLYTKLYQKNKSLYMHILYLLYKKLPSSYSAILFKYENILVNIVYKILLNIRKLFKNKLK